MEKKFVGPEAERAEIYKRLNKWIEAQGKKIKDTQVHEIVVRKSCPDRFKPKKGTGELTATVTYKSN